MPPSAAAPAPVPAPAPVYAPVGPLTGPVGPGAVPGYAPPRPPAAEPQVPLMPQSKYVLNEKIVPGALQQIRERILQNPGHLQQIIQELQTTNPEIYQLFMQNPQQMMQLLLAGGAPRRPRPGGIPITPEDRAAIDRVYHNHIK